MSPAAASNYLNNVKVDGGFQADYAQGCFARMSDVRDINTPSGYREGLRLDYDDHTFPEDMRSVHVLRTSVTNPGNYDIPFGGTSVEGMHNIEGDKKWDPPFTGNGFTGSDRHLVPEWERTSSKLTDGDEIYEVYRDGTEKLVATFARQRWVPAVEEG